MGIVDIVRHIFPISNEMNWFIGVYLIIYCIHPALNKIISSIDKRTHISICIVLLILFSFMQKTVANHKLFYSEVFGAIEIYFIVSYAKMYMSAFWSKKCNCHRCIIVSLFGCILGAVVANAIGILVPQLSWFPGKWASFINPFVISLAIGLFFLFSNKPIWSSKIVNQVASLSLLYYIIYENSILCTYIKDDIWLWIYNTLSYKYIIAIAISLSICAFVMTGIVSYAYKISIKKYINNFGNVLFSIISRMFSKCITYITRIN